MSPVTRAITTALALLAIAAPASTAAPSRDAYRASARADTNAAPQQDRRDNVFTGGVRAPDWLSPNAGEGATAATTTTAARAAGAPTVDERSDWTSAGIGAAAGIALLVVALAAAAAVAGRSRPAPH